jgi:uncharacterized membrane protein YGL010W
MEERLMRSATTWFEMYGESHQNKTNKAIHWVCIPAILLASIGLIQSIPHPFAELSPLLSWAAIAWALCLVFYVRLSWTLGVGMALVGVACFAINMGIVAAGLSLPLVSLGIFFVAWVVQFVGHRIEGKKPSFFQDLQFLLVGPAWLLQFVYQQVGIPVETRVTA